MFDRVNERVVVFGCTMFSHVKIVKACIRFAKLSDLTMIQMDVECVPAAAVVCDVVAIFNFHE